MSDCPAFEDLLKEGSQVHAAQCPRCRELLEALTCVDETLDAAFGKIGAPPDLESALRARIARVRAETKPSILPEILDLIGWAAVLAAAAIAVPYFASLLGAAIPGLG